MSTKFDHRFKMLKKIVQRGQSQKRIDRALRAARKEESTNAAEEPARAAEAPRRAI